MELNEKLMLAIFKQFIKRPQYINRSHLTREIIYEYNPPNRTEPNDVIHWHIVLFLNEFVLDSSRVDTFGTDSLRLIGADYLTWSGHKLFQELQHLHPSE